MACCSMFDCCSWYDCCSCGSCGSCGSGGCGTGSCNTGETGNQTGCTSGTYDPNTGQFTPSPSIWDKISKFGGKVGNALTAKGVIPGGVLAGLAYSNQSDINKQIMDAYNQNQAQTKAFETLYSSGKNLPQLPIYSEGLPTFAAPGSAAALPMNRTAENVVVAPKKANGGIMSMRQNYADGTQPNHPQQDQLGMITEMIKRGADTSTISSITGIPEEQVKGIVSNMQQNMQRRANGGIIAARKHYAQGTQPQGIEELMIHVKKSEDPKEKFDKALKQVKHLKKNNPAKYRSMLDQVKKHHANRISNNVKKMTMQKDIQTALENIQRMKANTAPSMMPRRNAAIGGMMNNMSTPVMNPSAMPTLQPSAIPSLGSSIMQGGQQPMQGMPQGGIQQALRNNPQLMQQLMQRKQAGMQGGMQNRMQGGLNPMQMPMRGPATLAAGGIPEIDYRDKGGYVPPIGKKERADDIPAMLSNNEFVFTANAVRNAGGGDVKHGAKKMYALMKHLEGKK